MDENLMKGIVERFLKENPEANLEQLTFTITGWALGILSDQEVTAAIPSLAEMSTAEKQQILDQIKSDAEGLIPTEVKTNIQSLHDEKPWLSEEEIIEEVLKDLRTKVTEEPS